MSHPCFLSQGQECLHWGCQVQTHPSTGMPAHSPSPTESPGPEEVGQPPLTCTKQYPSSRRCRSLMAREPTRMSEFWQ